MISGHDTTSGLRGLGRPVRIFLSYAPEDEPYREELVRHLELLRRKDIIEVWHDRLISAGEDHEYERRRRFEEADVILLLISADYLASDSAYAEMEAAMARQQLGATRIVALLLRSVDLNGSSIHRFPSLPRDGKPISLWPSRDEAWVDVVQGIRNVIDYSVTRSDPSPSPQPGARKSMSAREAPAPAALESASLPPAPPPPAGAPEPRRPTLPLGDIFRRGKQPDVTFVEPSQLKLLKVHLRTMGQGLVVEGPSGIGKTTAVNKAREAIAPDVPYRRVRSLVPADLLALDEALSSGFTGHLFIDDFHHLDERRMRNVASAIKVLADDSRDDAKITVIGINPVGVSLMHNFPDLAGRFDRVSMTRQPDPSIAELITRGEAAANVTFLRRDELINAAAGSFFTAQQLCFHACVHAGIDETQPTRTEIDVGIHAVLDAVMDSLHNKYHDRLRNFSAWDRTIGRPGAFLALLWLLSRDREGFVSVVEASLQFPRLEEAFAWLGAGNLESAFAGIPGLSELFYFNARAGVLTAEDPQLVFYLSHMSWADFARRSGHAQVRVDPGGLLVFAGAGPVTAGAAERPSGDSISALPPSSVLHLSDLHFGTLEQATLWYGQLAEDLRELGCTRLDAAVLSGDISNRAAPDEYDAARALLERLMAEFGLPSGGIVLVPGNHDLSWPLARSAYRLERRADHPGTLTDGLYIDRGEIVEVRSEEAYRRRFEPFSAFHDAVKGQPYPLEYAQQAVLQHFPEQKLLFLGLNSAWQLDHHFKIRAAIHGGALSDALFRIRTTPEYAGCLKIAVWHHPISGDGDDRLRDTGFLEQLAKAGFRLALHGHIHQARNELFRYDMSAGDRRLDVVCAGTFGAPVNEWVPGYPLGYNLLRFGRGKVIVETRRREELNGAWKPDARWLRGPGADPLPRYEIQL